MLHHGINFIPYMKSEKGKLGSTGAGVGIPNTLKIFLQYILSVKLVRC